jgi:outer membrane protein TolC
MRNTRSVYLRALPLLFLLAAPRLVLGQQETTERLTLDQAITLALRDNRLVKNSSLAVAKVEDQLAATRTLRLPNLNFYMLGSQQLSALNFTFNPGTFGTFAGIGPIPAQKTVLSTPVRPTALIVGSVSQPLSQQYRIKLHLDQLQLSRAVAAEELRHQQQVVVNGVKQLYYGIAQSQSALRSNKQSILLYRELDRVTGEYVAQQVALKSQSLEIKARLARVEYEGLNLRNQIAAQKEQLNNLLGRDIRIDFEVNPVAENTSFETDLVAAQTRALEQRAEMKEARLKVKQADLERRLKKAESLPDVSLSLNYLSPRNFDDFVPKTFATAGVVVSWNVFDWGRKGHELDAQRKTSQQALNALRETESKILIDVNTKFRKLQQTDQLLRIARLAQDAARENLRVAQNKYRLQAVLLSDLLQTQSSLAEADNQYEQALAGFWSAKAEFENALGDDK